MPSIPLKLVSRALAWGLAILVLHAGFLNVASLLVTGWNLIAWTLGRQVVNLLFDLLSLAIVLKVFVWLVGLISPETAKSLGFLDNLLPQLLKALAKGSATLWKLFMWLAEGKPMKQAKKQQKGAKESG